jgi:hypothetical protein
MEAVITGEGPQGGERLVEHNIFLTDSFKNGSKFRDQYYGIPGEAPMDIQNDESYRRSRHLARLATVDEDFDGLREHSRQRQLQPKEDRVSTIRLVRRLNAAERAQAKTNEAHLPWVNLIPPNTKFFLESVQENREEKVQVIDTFGEWIAFFFGRKPEVYSYSGTLLNAKNHNWKNEFQQSYDLFLRGSQAVKHRATVMLQYDDVIVEGYILNNSIQMNAMAENAVPFSFNMLVISRSPVDAAGMLGARLDRSGGTLLEQELYADMREALDLSQSGQIDDIETFFLMREYFSGNYSPGAGTSIHRAEAGNIESETSTTPGQVGGLTNDKPKSTAVSTQNTDAIVGSGSTSAKLRGATQRLPQEP